MNPDLYLTKATKAHFEAIWDIIVQAKEQMKREGRTQWNEAYPSLEVIQNDINKGDGYVLCSNDEVIAYAVLILTGEEAYNSIEGEWLSNGSYIVLHRLAVAENVKNRGIAAHLMKLIEKCAVEESIFSFKIDTNYDNVAMLKLLDRAGFSYCGKVKYAEDKVRLAFEKLLS